MSSDIFKNILKKNVFANPIIKRNESKSRARAAEASDKSKAAAATAERVSADEDLRRQRLFQNPVQDEEEILSKRKQLLGQ